MATSVRCARFLAPLAVSALAFLSCSAEPERPNLILVTLDTFRADVLGSYGSSKGLTPALDRFAGRSVVLENGAPPSGAGEGAMGSPTTGEDGYAGWQTYRHEATGLVLRMPADYGLLPPGGEPRPAPLYRFTPLGPTGKRMLTTVELVARRQGRG